MRELWYVESHEKMDPEWSEELDKAAREKLGFPVRSASAYWVARLADVLVEAGFDRQEISEDPETTFLRPFGVHVSEALETNKPVAELDTAELEAIWEATIRDEEKE